MGAVVSRFRRGKPSTIQQLEALEKDMIELEERSERTQRLQRLWIGRLILYSSCIYIVAAAILWFWNFPKQWTDWVFAALPLLIFPILVWLLKRFMSWWFVRRTQRNYAALEELKDKKRKILEEVMEKETYKTAKEILERFDSEAKKAKELEQAAISPPSVGQDLRQRTLSQRGIADPAASSPIAPTAGGPSIQTPTRGPPGTASAGRGSPLVLGSPGGPGTAPGGPPEKGLLAGGPSGILVRRPGGGHVAATPAAHVNFPPSHLGMHPPGPPLPRPVLPRERGVADRVIEYLVGDGPQNRYALICQQCFSHNGMALREEFEYIAYRCAYCFSLNPARRTRPLAPRLGEPGGAQPQPRPGPIAAATATPAGPGLPVAGAEDGQAASAVAGGEECDADPIQEEPAVPVADDDDGRPSASGEAGSGSTSPPEGQQAGAGSASPPEGQQADAGSASPPEGQQAGAGSTSPPEGQQAGARDETGGDGASTTESVSPESHGDAETPQSESPVVHELPNKSVDESMDVS